MHKKLLINKNQIKLIHVAKREVGMTDGEYRCLLGSVGATSSKQLTQSCFDSIMRHFEHLGFRSSRADLGGQKDAMLRKIEVMLKALGKHSRYADGIAKKVCKVDRVRWCAPKQMQKVIAALQYQVNRERQRERDRAMEAAQ